MVEFSTWQACQVVARHAIYEVPLRATLECLVQSALRRRGSVHLQREYRRLRSTTLKKLLATTRCGAAMAASVATIPSIRPNGARSGLSDQLAQAVQSSSARGQTSITLAKKFASKTTPFCSQWWASSQRAPNRRKLLKRPGQFRRLIIFIYLVIVIFWLFFLRKTTLKTRLI